MSKRPPRYDVPTAAPDELRLVQLFVNTTDHEHGRELLGSPRELGEWLAAHGLLGTGARVSRADLANAIALREALRALLATNRDGRPSPEAAAELNRAAARARIEVRAAGAGTADVVVLAGGVDGALGRIAATALEAMLDGRWRRLKACRNCGWAFYDHSRNRAATWCSMTLCGNRQKTRRYRERVRAAHG